MEALSGTVPERAAAALAAGCDVALNCWAKMDDMAGICIALRGMSDAAAARLTRALAGMGKASRSDEQAGLVAKRDALLALLDGAEVTA